MWLKSTDSIALVHFAFDNILKIEIVAPQEWLGQTCCKIEIVRRGRELRVPTESSAAHPAEDEGQSLARQRVDPHFHFENFHNFIYIYVLNAAFYK